MKNNKIKVGQLFKPKAKPPIMRVGAVCKKHLVLEEAYPCTTDAQTICTYKEFNRDYRKTSYKRRYVKKFLLLPLTIYKEIRHYLKDCQRQRKAKIKSETNLKNHL